MTTEERAKQIIEAIKTEEGTDPAEIFRHMARKDFVRMHGPEHHILDGAAILTAFRNAVAYINSHYDVTLTYEEKPCEFSERNEQCIRERCPFYRG